MDDSILPYDIECFDLPCRHIMSCSAVCSGTFVHPQMKELVDILRLATLQEQLLKEDIQMMDSMMNPWT